LHISIATHTHHTLWRLKFLLWGFHFSLVHSDGHCFHTEPQAQDEHRAAAEGFTPQHLCTQENITSLRLISGYINSCFKGKYTGKHHQAKVYWLHNSCFKGNYENMLNIKQKNVIFHNWSNEITLIYFSQT
jgi:hypothetical protein